MPDTTTATTDPAAAVTEAQALIARADTKAALLLAAVAASLSLSIPAAGTLPGPARIPAALTATALAAAAVLLLLVVRPAGGPLTPATVTVAPADRLAVLCPLATRKLTAVRRAVDVLLVALALAAITTATALTSA